MCVLSLSRKHLPNHRMLIIEAGTQTLSRIYYLQSRAGIITGLTNALLSISRGGLSHVCNVSISVYNKHYCLYMKPPRNLGFFVLRFPFKEMNNFIRDVNIGLTWYLSSNNLPPKKQGHVSKYAFTKLQSMQHAAYVLTTCSSFEQHLFDISSIDSSTCFDLPCQRVSL